MRRWEVDALRGFAVAAMVVDHLALFAGAELLRLTVGRLALPVFFVLGGALLSRPTWRHAVVAGVGLVLPVVAGWIDSPNVLLIYGAGALVLAGGARWLGPAWVWVVLVAALTVWANGWTPTTPGAYSPGALVAMLAVGVLLRRSVGLEGLTAAGARLPRWLARVGRFPLTVYVGHVLVLTAAAALGR